jgi:Ran GTPase-activating protein (RanGAP) involved in mRNA processing and transport
VIINQFLYFQVIPKEIQEKIFIECKNEYSLRLVSKGFSCILNGRIYSLIPKELVKRSMTIFSYFINELPNLKLLDLGDIYIGEKGIQWLAKALIRNTTITALDLEGNDIGDEGAQWLAKVLMNNAKLKMLSLYNNNIGNEGAQSLSNALTSNTTLMTLNLGYNDITWSCPY